MDRISWDEYLITEAFIASLRSEDCFRKVGAACSSKNHKLISTGYNGLAAGFDAPKDLYLDRESGKEKRYKLTIHAEMNALARCKPGKVHTMATTCSPCANCATIMAAHGVRKVLMIEEYHREQSYKEIFDFYKIEFKVIHPPDIFQAYEKLQKMFPGAAKL